MMRRGIVHVVPAGQASLDLQGCVVDAEKLIQRVRRGVDERVVVMIQRPHQWAVRAISWAPNGRYAGDAPL